MTKLTYNDAVVAQVRRGMQRAEDEFGYNLAQGMDLNEARNRLVADIDSLGDEVVYTHLVRPPMTVGAAGRAMPVAPVLPVDDQVSAESSDDLSPRERLVSAITEILNNDETPGHLWDAVTQFMTDGVQIKNSEGDSLLERWNRAPETVRAVLAWAQEAADNESALEALRETVASNQRGPRQAVPERRGL